METFLPENRGEALNQLDEFVKIAGAYARQRNRVVRDHLHVSRLSPAIRCRMVTEEEVVQAVLKENSGSRVEKFVQEVAWRLYWKGWLELRPQVWTRYVEDLQGLKEVRESESMQRAELGRTGVEVMDGFARELIETGYLHNHARMWFAGYWIHVLGLPWQLGADFFYRHLLDADPASNTLSWRWVAGLQTPGKTYLPRVGNLRKHCDAECLSEDGLEHLEGVKARTVEESLDRSASGLEPSDSLNLRGRIGLWLTGEDVLLEDSPLDQLDAVSVAAFRSPGLLKRFGVSEGRKTFMTHAFEDGLMRAERYFRCPTELRTSEDLGVALLGWAHDFKLDHVVMMRPAVGPLSMGMEHVRKQLHGDGIGLHQVRRPCDEELFPLAQRGFFQFWAGAKKRLQSWDRQGELFAQV